MKSIDEVGYPSKRGSDYFLIHDGRYYPPKVVIDKAHEIRYGEAVDGLFGGWGGQGRFIWNNANTYLNDRGFAIVEGAAMEAALDKLVATYGSKEQMPEMMDMMATRKGVFSMYRPLIETAKAGRSDAGAVSINTFPENARNWTLVGKAAEISKAVSLPGFLTALLDTQIRLAVRLDRAKERLDKEGFNFGEAKTMAILAASDPVSYGIWTADTDPVLKRLGLTPRVPKDASFGSKCEIMNELLVAMVVRLNERLRVDPLLDNLDLVAIFHGFLESAVLQEDSAAKMIAPIGASHEKRIRLLRMKRQVILYGPPGTGKTFSTRELSTLIAEVNNLKDIDIDREFSELQNEGRIQFVTFHPSYSYEEFVEGISVELAGDGRPSQGLQYCLKNGIFKEMAKKAIAAALYEESDTEGKERKTMAALLNEYQKAMGELIDGRSYSDARSRVAEWWEGKPRFVLIIDEINRGDISKILGELITLLEMDKRLGMDNELVVTLPYSRERFAVPPNLYIIGTMNTADKSIALLDIALRRRFGFIEMAPDFPLLRTSWSEIHANQAGTEVERLFKESVSAVERINTRIASNHSIGRDKRIGHAFFFKATSLDDLIMIWNNEIIPLLEEYCYGRYELMSELVFGRSVPAWFSMERGFRSIDTPADLAEFLGVGIADGQK